MAFHRTQFTPGIGARMAIVRKQLNYTRHEMGAILGMRHSGYYKNEAGETFPSANTLFWFQKEYDISMDWLLFNKGPMRFKQKPSPGPKDQFPELQELIGDMEQDTLLMHEILAYYLKYKTKKKP
ncbi:MAG: hypothetical protein GY950_17020 [bacterium]|nr:hypothetical protein [bacterium]